MVIKRKSKETEFKEKLETLVEVLEELNKENDKISLGGGCFRNRKEGEIRPEDIMLASSIFQTCLYRLEKKESKLFNKYHKSILAHLELNENNNIIFQATSQEYMPVLEKICKVYERKTLKDEPIIEY